MNKLDKIVERGTESIRNLLHADCRKCEHKPDGKAVCDKCYFGGVYTLYMPSTKHIQNAVRVICSRAFETGYRETI